MEYLTWALDLFLHLDRHLNEFADGLGVWLYVILFIVVFCETGLVVTPFLPGDSLLFAVGALAATADSSLSVKLLGIVLITAAILGDAVNYAIGYRVGPKIFSSDTSWLFNKQHLHRAQRFYERHGGKTIVLARFIPIIRTFAPFVAGIGQMRYPRFAFYNVAGAIAWVVIFLGAGYQFGNMPAVKENFSLVILAIIVISVMPAVVEWLLEKRRTRAAVEVE
ncbi:MAG: DedA family protein [Gemmataceae bacterium]